MFFAKEKINYIKRKVFLVSELVGSSVPASQYSFPLYTAEFVYKARRALTNIYISRYYMKGMQRLEFLDFLINELARTLEILTVCSEFEWI